MLDKEEQLLKKRISELASLCYQRDIRTYTGFLTLNEQAVFHSIEHALPPVSIILAGGCDAAERKIVCFLPSSDAGDKPLPIDTLEILPAAPRFAQKLGHRDFLGTVMSLGVERSCIGDIIMRENGCYLFCLDRMTRFFTEELRAVRCTPVICQRVEEAVSISQAWEEINGSVASPRLDSIIAMVFHIRRAEALSYIEGDRVFINGRPAVSAGMQLKGDEIVSVRGLGKFRYMGNGKETRKGRIYVSARRYC